MIRQDSRTLTVYCWADGSGFGWKAPGGALFPQTGYFEECPFLTIDVDIEGRILDVGFAFDAKTGRLENDIECSIDRHCEDDLMIWTITLPQGIFLACKEEETWRAVGKLADTLSVTLTPRNEMLTLSVKSRKLGA